MRCTVADMKSLYVRLLISVVIVLVNLRDSEIKQDLPKQCKNHCSRGFGCSGALLWNSLPVYVRKLDSVERFERDIVRQAPTQQCCKKVNVVIIEHLFLCVTKNSTLFK